jgi:ferrous-iron efflux pump FieF
VSPVSLTAEQHAREDSVRLAIVMDISIAVAFVTVSVVGGSFTLLAETVRGMLGLVPEVFTYGVVRRIHRGTLRDFDYGTAKLEQIVSVAIGFSMLFAVVWIVRGGITILAGERELGTPFGLACAAVAGMLNLWINLVAWDSVRRVVRADDSPMMRAQLTVRWTKLLASVIIAVDLTVAALSTDPVVVALADGLGAFIVAAYMVMIAYQTLRDVLPDLLELAASQSIRLGVVRGLARHAGDYTELQNVRTRRSSQAAFVEIALAFDDSLSMAEVNRRIEALKATMREEVGEAEVTVLASAAPR